MLGHLSNDIAQAAPQGVEERRLLLLADAEADHFTEPLSYGPWKSVCTLIRLMTMQAAAEAAFLSMLNGHLRRALLPVDHLGMLGQICGPCWLR